MSFESWFYWAAWSAKGLPIVVNSEMFDASDIPFDGIPSWLYAEFAEKYRSPHSCWLELGVGAFVGRKLIYVHYQSGSEKHRRNDGSYAWSGWRIQYKKGEVKLLI